LEFFSVDAADLTREQQFEIALRQIAARARRFKILAISVCFITVVAAAVTAYAIAIAPSSNDAGEEESAEYVQSKNDNVFSDHFSGQTLDDSWQPVTGDWYIRNGILNGEAGSVAPDPGTLEIWGLTETDDIPEELEELLKQPAWAAITLVEEVPNNCVVSFRIQIVAGSTGELMLHLARNRYVRVYIYEIDQSVNLGDGSFLRENRPGWQGHEEVLANIGGGFTLAQHAFPVKLGVWYQMNVSALQNEYKVQIGGQTIIEYRDSTNQLSDEGTLGFLTNGHVRVDDVIVAKLPSSS
jgi:hypothetical protein